jgi:2-octaprenyl-6-methoxyphenol hydroxylase
MDTPTYDILIQGAGPVGSALALMFARNAVQPARIALTGHIRAPGKIDPGGSPDAPDPRTLALNHGSRTLLELLEAWPQRSADIRFVHVSQRGRLGRTIISHEEMKVPRLGSVVAYEDLLGCLHRTLEQSGVTLLNASPEQSTLGDGDGPVSRLTVLSDGSKPKGVQRDYGQHALLATVQAGAPRAAWAYERFTREGPLAVLPHPQGPEYYGVVWCGSPERTAELQQLDDDTFSLALADMFGTRLGRLRAVGARHVFPLAMHAGPNLINDRSIAVGNAAQTLHPVAGQGLNLGLRDAMQLSLALTPWLGTPEQDGRAILARFAQQRRPDRLLTAAVTDFLPRIFATGNPLMEHACGVALMGLDAAPPMRHAFSRHLLQGMRT